MTTLVHTTNRTLVIAADFNDVVNVLATGTVEVTTATGERALVIQGTVTGVDEVIERERNAVGFTAALERYEAADELAHNYRLEA